MRLCETFFIAIYMMASYKYITLHPFFLSVNTHSHSLEVSTLVVQLLPH